MTPGLTMELVVPSTMALPLAQEALLTDLPVHVYSLVEGEAAGFLYKLQWGYEEVHADVIGYCHSDLSIHDQGWEARVLDEFKWPNVGVVGFVGATGLGHDDIFKIPYSYTQLARCDVWSNLTDAEAHGQRLIGSKRVAVVDSCAVFVRRDLLVRCGGWPLGAYPNSSHCTDLWVCLMAHRMGMRTQVVGVSATHTGGGKGEVGSKWLEARGTDDVLHKQAHVVTYNTFRSELPLRVKA